MAIITTIPTNLAFPHRGQVERDEFVILQETAQDLLSGDFTTSVNLLAQEMNEVAENAINAITLDAIEDLATYTGTGLVIVKDINRGGNFVSKTVIEIDPNTGSLYVANSGTVFTKFGGGFWARQYSGAVNVKWFGAKGDGVTDDTVAIQNALLLSKDIECNNLDTYVISDTLVIDRQITFNGRNSTFKSLIANGKPLFEIHTTSNTPNDEKKFGQVCNIDFGNIIIDGNNKNVIGVQLDYLIGSHFHDIYIVDCHNSAIQIGYENPPTNNTVDAIRESSFSRISTNRCGSSSLNKASLQWFTCPFEIVNSSLSTDIYFTDIRLIENNWKALVIETHRRTTPSVGNNYGVITTVFEKLQIDTNTSTIQNCNVVELSHCGYGISFKDSFFVGLPSQATGTWGYSMFKLGSSLAYANQVNSISFTNNRFQNNANGHLIQSVRCDSIRFSGNDLGTIETRRGVVFAVVNPTDLLSVFSNNLTATTFISDNNDWGLTDVFFSNKNLVDTVGEYRNTAGIFTNFQTNKVFITTTSFTGSYIIDLKPYIDALDIDLQFVRLTVYAFGGGVRSYGSADMLLLDANSSAGVKSYNIVNKNSAIIDLYVDSPYGFGDFHGGEGYKFRVGNNIAATSTTAKILIEFL